MCAVGIRIIQLCDRKQVILIQTNLKGTCENHWMVILALGSKDCRGRILKFRFRFGNSSFGILFILFIYRCDKGVIVLIFNDGVFKRYRNQNISLIICYILGNMCGCNGILPLFFLNIHGFGICRPINRAVQTFGNGSQRHKGSAVYDFRRNIQLLCFAINGDFVFADFQSDPLIASVCRNHLRAILLRIGNGTIQCFKNLSERHKGSAVFNHGIYIKLHLTAVQLYRNSIRRIGRNCTENQHRT